MKTEYPTFGLIFNLNMLLAILMEAIARNYKMGTMALLLKVETCNKNWTLLSWGSNLNMLLSIYDNSHHQKLQKLLWQL